MRLQQYSVQQSGFICIWLSAKRCACKGLCTSVENKTLFKTVLAWMNEYIVQIISATRLRLISRYSHHTLKKCRKMSAKNGHPCTEWFLLLCLQTNHKHMEKQSLIFKRKTLFYMGNITSTLTIVVFLMNWSQMFALYVQKNYVVQTRTENFEQPKNDSITSESPETSSVFWSMHLHYTAILFFFFSEVLDEIWRIFPRSFDTVVISNAPTRYLIFCTKQTRKQSFLSTTSGRSHDLSYSFLMTFPTHFPSFSRPHGVFLFENTERCVVVSFSGPT